MALETEKVTDEKKGSSVNLVKTSIKKGESSNVKVGKKIQGILADDIQPGKSIFIQTRAKGENCHRASSEVIGIDFPKKPINKMVIETKTSIYEQIL